MVLATAACKKLFESVISLYRTELVKQCKLYQEIHFGKIRWSCI